MNEYDFQERLAWSEGHKPSIEAIIKIIKNRIPGCTGIQRATPQADKDGTDYFANRHQNTPLSIDLKLREEDYKSKGHDDLALETWSVIPENGRQGKIGWTRDPQKRTDYILWYWQDTGRFCLVSFHALCFVFQKRWEKWRKLFPPHVQNSGSWKSECVFVPRHIVFKSIHQWANNSFKI